MYMSAYASTEQFGSWPWHWLTVLKFVFYSTDPTKKCKPSLTAVVLKILHLKIMWCHQCQLHQTYNTHRLTKQEECTLLISQSIRFQSNQLHSTVLWLPFSTYCGEWNCPWYVTQMLSQNLCNWIQCIVNMMQPDIHAVSLITDFFLYTCTTQVSLFVCWGIGKFTCSCIVLFSIIIIIYITTTTTTTTSTTTTIIIAAATAGICEIH